MFRRMRLIGLALAGILGLAELGVGAQPTPRATGPAAAAPASAIAAKPVAPNQKPVASNPLITAADEILVQVSKLRGLPIKRPVPRGLLSRAEITRHLLDGIDKDYAEAEIAAEERTFKRLGLLPEGADYKKVVIDILTDEIAGFYDPRAKQLYLADWIEVGLQRPVLAHELCHALQDQAFDLEKTIGTSKDNGDQDLAREALVEGDALGVMIEFLLRETKISADPWSQPELMNLLRGPLTSELDGKLGQAPLFLREALMFPYLGGLGLIAEARRTNSWARVDQMYASPPRSTEQVLHPAKYFAGEKPVEVKVPALASLKGWREIHRTVVGELLFSVLLRQHGVVAARADEAAAGWGGDRLVAYAPPGDLGRRTGDGVLVLLLSTWDHELEADEAFASAADALASLAGGTCRQGAERTEVYATCPNAAGGVSFVERRGDRLLWVVGAPGELAAKVREEAWRRWRGVARR